MNAPGKSLLVAPNGSASAFVTAPPGTVLHYLCAFYPWMQGQIAVQ